MTDPLIKRGSTRSVVGLEVDTLDLSLLCSSDSTLNGVPATRYAIEGSLDGARVVLERVYAERVGGPEVGALSMFSGTVGDLKIDATEIAMSINSDVEQFNISMPRNVFMAPCGRTLFDAGCALSRGAFTSSSAVASGSTHEVINCALSEAAGYFDQGTITFTSGVHNNVSRTITKYTTGVITLALPLSGALVAPSIGDSFDVIPGCDKTKATCETKFANLQHFRGFPFVPSPEATY